VKPYDRDTMTYDQENVLVHLSNNAFSYHNLENVCYFCDYVIAYKYFLANSDSKNSYVFPLMINVVLRISHKECYWVKSDYKDLFL
jgi:hypothetical protein